MDGNPASPPGLLAASAVAAVARAAAALGASANGVAQAAEAAAEALALVERQCGTEVEPLKSEPRFIPMVMPMVSPKDDIAPPQLQADAASDLDPLGPCKSTCAPDVGQSPKTSNSNGKSFTPSTCTPASHDACEFYDISEFGNTSVDLSWYILQSDLGRWAEAQILEGTWDKSHIPINGIVKSLFQAGNADDDIFACSPNHAETYAESVDDASMEALSREPAMLTRPPEQWRIHMKDISTADKVLANTVFTVDVMSDYTVADLKLQIQADTGIVASSQSLVQAGTEFRDELALAEYNIAHGSTIYWVIRRSVPEQT